MVTAIISLGSNTADCHTIIANALADIKPMIVEHTAPYCDASQQGKSSQYLNVVAIISTDIDHETLRQYFKELERKAGRTPILSTAGIIPLDIDIVIYDGIVMRPCDLAQPYFTQGYNQLSLSKIR